METQQFIESFRNYKEMENKETTTAMILALYKVHRKAFWFTMMTAMVAEILAIYCCYQIGFLIEFMQTVKSPSMSEVSFLIMFSLAFMTQIFLRNLHYFFNTMLSLKMKKLFMNAIYQKCSKLPLDCMDEIGDGKLITLL